MGLWKDIKNLLIGMKITSKHLGKHAITIQYPEQKWTMPERSRGIVVLLSDKETGDLNCTACMLCMKACPTGAIIIKAPRDEATKKRNLQGFDIDFGLCCFCGLCEEACNFSALKMAPKYEFSTIHKDDLVWNVKKLQEMGRDVDYVDTRKKKAEAKPAAGGAAGTKPAAAAAQPATAAEPKVQPAPATISAPVAQAEQKGEA